MNIRKHRMDHLSLIYNMSDGDCSVHVSLGLWSRLNGNNCNASFCNNCHPSSLSRKLAFCNNCNASMCDFHRSCNGQSSNHKRKKTETISKGHTFFKFITTSAFFLVLDVFKMWLDMALLSDSDTSSDCHFVLHSRIPRLSNRTLHLQQLLRYLSISFRSSPTANLNSTSQSGCWTKPAVDRIVITILDALRFDFVAPSYLFPEKKPWMDKLQVLQKLTSEEGSFSTIFKAIADPPTITLQHLKVKRYIDTYSASSVIGFPSEDLVHVDNIYAEAQDSWSQMIKNLSLPENEVHGRSCDTSLVTNVQEQIHAYSGFLASVAELARSKWTEFDLMMMGLGLGILLLSLFIHLLIMRRVNKLLQISRPSVGSSRVSVRFVSALCGGTTRMQFPCK